MGSKFKVGDRVRFVERGYNERQRVGADATVIALDEDGDAILDTDMPGEAVGWANAIEVIHRPGDAPAITPLDDVGRAALKAGDRVLVEATVVDEIADDDGDRMISGEYTGGSWTQHHKGSAIYALLPPAHKPPAPKPIAAGDRVRILGGQVGKAIGQASDGTWAVEYDAGDGVKVGGYDASCLEVVS